jgi:rubrerythrin
MPNLTTKELSALEDQLNYEKLMIKKYNSFSDQCSDPQLKSKCKQIAQQHQQHYNRLFSYLQ